MGFLEKITALFAPSAKTDRWAYTFAVRCLRCGESIPGRVDLRNELSAEYDEDKGVTKYVCRKVLIGSGASHCFQAIEVRLTFDADYKLTDRQITGGKFLDEA